ncbi:unnamed protein product, partial [Pylaiella littoralis]
WTFLPWTSDNSSQRGSSLELQVSHAGHREAYVYSLLAIYFHVALGGASKRYPNERLAGGVVTSSVDRTWHHSPTHMCVSRRHCVLRLTPAIFNDVSIINSFTTA